MGRARRDFTNQRFGRLVVIEATDEKTSNGAVKWLCLCDCGNTTRTRSDQLSSGKIQSCGCLYVNDLTNKRFGQLIALYPTDQRASNRTIIWECICDCGNTTLVPTDSLLSGNTQSCGCFLPSTIHGRCYTSEYSSWKNMIQRCSNPNSINYKDYGGRGIVVCQRWMTFENFYDDMGDKPTPEHTIERNDNDGNYEKSNCRWATPWEQAQNRRS